MKYNTITRKIALQVIGDDINDQWKKIREMDFENHKAMNKVLSTLYSKENLIESAVKSKFTPTEYRKLDKKQISEVYKETNKKISELINSKSLYTDLVLNFQNLPTNSIPSVIKNAESLYKTNFMEMKRGNVSLPTIKKGYPIVTIKKYLKINSDYEFNWYSKVRLKLFFGRDRSNNKSVVDNVLSGEYILCDSSVQLKENKLFLLLVCKVPKKEVHLNKDITVGVDLGVSFSAVCALNKGFDRLIVPNSILEPRLRIQTQRKGLQRAMKYVKGGKGRNKKLKKVYDLKNAERNTVKTLNHKISHDIVNFALKNNAYKIYLEDLKGFSKERKDSFILRNWSYFELQKMIKQKADKYSILVETVSPSYTSQTCNCCKSKGQRERQSEFICKNKKCELYDKKINADYNAAKNISFGGLGFTYNKETKEFFESLEYGQVVLPEAEGKIHSASSSKIKVKSCESVIC